MNPFGLFDVLELVVETLARWLGRIRKAAAKQTRPPSTLLTALYSVTIFLVMVIVVTWVVWELYFAH